MSYRRLNLTNFRGFKLDPAFTAFSHDDSSSNSGLDGCVDSWPPEIHIPWRIGCSHKHSLEQMVPKSALWHALSLCDSRITPIIITDITGRCNVRIQIPYTCTTSSDCGHRATKRLGATVYTLKILNSKLSPTGCYYSISLWITEYLCPYSCQLTIMHHFALCCPHKVCMGSAHMHDQGLQQWQCSKAKKQQIWTT